jgi:hypothetical protein
MFSSLSIPNVFVAVPFDMWHDWCIRFTSESEEDFLTYIIESTGPTALGSNPALRALIASERLRLQGFTRDSASVQRFIHHIVYYIIDIDIFEDTLEFEDDTEPTGFEDSFILRLHEQHEDLPFEYRDYCKHLRYRVEFQGDVNVLADVTATEKRRLALAMMFHARLGADSFDANKDVISGHVADATGKLLDDFINTDELVYHDPLWADDERHVRFSEWSSDDSDME